MLVRTNCLYVLVLFILLTELHCRPIVLFIYSAIAASMLINLFLLILLFLVLVLVLVLVLLLLLLRCQLFL